MSTENKLLVVKDLTCSTCAHHRIVGKIPDIDECDIMDHTPTESDKKLIHQMGCASHHLALQVLAKPVIGELERCKRQEHLLPEDTKQGVFEMAIDYATKLLKNEVVIP